MFILLLLTALVSGCTRTQSERGVQPVWLSLPESSLSVGTTTRSDVLTRLGPPSQVITHADGEIFYYLHEQSESRGLILLVYNSSQTETRYDRAIFFFDAHSVLRDYSLQSGDEEG